MRQQQKSVAKVTTSQSLRVVGRIDFSPFGIEFSELKGHWFRQSDLANDSRPAVA